MYANFPSNELSTHLFRLWQIEKDQGNWLVINCSRKKDNWSGYALLGLEHSLRAMEHFLPLCHSNFYLTPSLVLLTSLLLKLHLKRELILTLAEAEPTTAYIIIDWSTTANDAALTNILVIWMDPSFTWFYIHIYYLTSIIPLDYQNSKFNFYESVENV